ncbi:MAG: thiamine phosphate synthase [Chthoniobacterales bacterium]
MELGSCRLYGILDLAYVLPANAASVAKAMIEGGVDVMQLRAKNQNQSDLVTLAKMLRALTSARHVPFVVNDYPDIARSVDADGAHVGQDDMPIAEARREAGPDCIIGKSTHSLAQAKAAIAEGADYIGFGPLFATPTKPDYDAIGLADIAAMHGMTDRPIFCIGGIKLENLPDVIAAGARRVVIVSGLLQAPDIARYARHAKDLLDQAAATQS